MRKKALIIISLLLGILIIVTAYLFFIVKIRRVFFIWKGEYICPNTHLPYRVNHLGIQPEGIFNNKKFFTFTIEIPEECSFGAYVPDIDEYWRNLRQNR